jgi:hypothetical protein
MKLQITLDIFSGRPNPTIEVSGAEAKKILEQVDLKSAFRKSSDKTVPEPSNLGYRGVLIKQLDKASEQLPQQFRMAHDRAYAGALSATANDNAFEKIVFDRFGDFKGLPDKREFRKYVDTEIQRYRTGRLEILKRWPFDIVFPPLVNTCKCAPDPDIATWNQASRVGLNNCYNYGTNYWSDTFAQPGEATGNKWTSLAGCTVAAGQRSAKDGAISDGLIDTPLANNKCPEKGHLVALVAAPNYDYHWYRKGPNGRWSHKPGPTPATLLDDNGAIITDPRTAARGPYTQFCTFMQVIHGHFKIT